MLDREIVYLLETFTSLPPRTVSSNCLSPQHARSHKSRHDYSQNPIFKANMDIAICRHLLIAVLAAVLPFTARFILVLIHLVVTRQPTMASRQANSLGSRRGLIGLLH